MEFIIGSFFVYFGFLILTLSVAVILLHIGFLVSWIKCKSAELGYWPYIKSKFNRRNCLITFVLVPLGLIFIIVVPSSMVAPYKGAVLRKELRNSSLLKIRTGGFCHRDLAREVEAYQTNDVKQINAFLDCIVFRPTHAGLHCMCCGELSFEFYKDNDMVGAFSLHHDTHIRILNSTSGDIYLSSNSCKLLDDWLSEKGIRKIQKELAAKQTAELETKLDEIENEVNTSK